MNVLHQSERKLTEQARKVIDSRLKVLSEQKESAEKSLNLVEDVTNYVEESLKTGSPQQVLKSKKQMMERMSNVTLPINLEDLYPKEKADFELSKDIKSLHHIGDILTHSSTALQQCRVKKVDCIIPTDKTLSFSLSMEAPDSSLLSVHTINDVKGPLGVAVNDDRNVVITERDGHCVTILDKGGNKVKSLGGEGGRGSANGQFQSPYDIAIDSQGIVYVTDYGNHRIQKFFPDGKFVGQFGNKRFGPGQLNGPMVMVIS
ncbi:PREDICTED: uncharacterized protein LOC109582685 [Amphimedon queenslandica]|uniref:Uncharacterized protein n=1 Tax=Amphimedon queenslandica TaxID=400682 RepID=A0AAN0J8S9_AMPQE|nr:PREDICTED: uncharacterized protein LOC109582685 [Amphimedon queenslandica]|eukprot:XP_019853113.1 PREDICTED: uncharacterized protein LOC109582685 [Amphimedon queenslandica]